MTSEESSYGIFQGTVLECSQKSEQSHKEYLYYRVLLFIV
jgi:hypothetical protein